MPLPHFETELQQEIDLLGTKLHFKADEKILKIGQTIRIIPLVLSGTIKISREDENGNELLLYYVNSNESCAMTFTCCMQNQASEIIAVAEEDVEILAIPIEMMDKWMMKYPTWKSFVMKTFQNRFNELLKTIDLLAFEKLDERLIHFLKEKSKVTNSKLINLSHEQIAQELATSRVVISRLLKKLENDNKLLLFRSQIKLLGEL